MRAIFGVLTLLIVLAIVGSVAKKNLQAFGAGSGGVASRQAAAASQATALAADPGNGRTVAVPGGMPAAMAADVSGMTVPQQSKALQDKVRDDTIRALQQGAEQNRQRADQN